MNRTSKTAYRRHKYSGPRKSLKRVRGGLKNFYSCDTRSKAWRPEITKKMPVQEDVLLDISTVPQLRTYSRVKQKKTEASITTPGTSAADTVIAGSLVINWPQAEPNTSAGIELDKFKRPPGVMENKLGISSAQRMNLANSISSEDGPDLVLIEPHIETIYIKVESGKEETNEPAEDAQVPPELPVKIKEEPMDLEMDIEETRVQDPLKIVV